MTTRSMIYDFLLDNGSDHATSNRNSGIVMELLHDNRPIVYEMLEDILQSDNLRSTHADKDLLEELYFLCPSLEQMPRVLASVVLMINENGVIDPDTAKQLIHIDRALADRKTQIAKLEESAQMLDLWKKHAKYTYEDAHFDFDRLTREEKEIFQDRDTWAQFCRWAQK